MDYVWLVFAGLAAFALLSFVSGEKQRQSDEAQAQAADSAAAGPEVADEVQSPKRH